MSTFWSKSFLRDEKNKLWLSFDTFFTIMCDYAVTENLIKKIDFNHCEESQNDNDEYSDNDLNDSDNCDTDDGNSSADDEDKIVTDMDLFKELVDIFIDDMFVNQCDDCKLVCRYNDLDLKPDQRDAQECERNQYYLNDGAIEEYFEDYAPSDDSYSVIESFVFEFLNYCDTATRLMKMDSLDKFANDRVSEHEELVRCGIDCTFLEMLAYYKVPSNESTKLTSEQTNFDSIAIVYNNKFKNFTITPCFKKSFENIYGCNNGCDDDDDKDENTSIVGKTIHVNNLNVDDLWSSFLEENKCLLFGLSFLDEACTTFRILSYTNLKQKYRFFKYSQFQMVKDAKIPIHLKRLYCTQVLFNDMAFKDSIDCVEKCWIKYPYAIYQMLQDYVRNMTNSPSLPALSSTSLSTTAATSSSKRARCTDDDDNDNNNSNNDGLLMNIVKKMRKN